jgi:hypothetical protein
MILPQEGGFSRRESPGRDIVMFILEKQDVF